MTSPMIYCPSYRYGAEDGPEVARVPPQDRPAGQDPPLLVKYPSHVEVPVLHAPEADIMAPTHPDPDSSPRIMTAAVLKEAHPGDSPARGALQGRCWTRLCPGGQDHSPATGGGTEQGLGGGTGQGPGGGVGQGSGGDAGQGYTHGGQVHSGAGLA